MLHNIHAGKRSYTKQKASEELSECHDPSSHCVSPGCSLLNHRLVMATALPILLGPCVYLNALSSSPYLTPVLTRSWEDVDHTLGNASLQCQLCKLQGCEWGHLNGEQGRSLWRIWMQSASRPPFTAFSLCTPRSSLSEAGRSSSAWSSRKTMGRPCSWPTIGTDHTASIPNISQGELGLASPHYPELSHWCSSASPGSLSTPCSCLPSVFELNHGSSSVQWDWLAGLSTMTQLPQPGDPQQSLSRRPASAQKTAGVDLEEEASGGTVPSTRALVTSSPCLCVTLSIAPFLETKGRPPPPPLAPINCWVSGFFQPVPWL